MDEKEKQSLRRRENEARDIGCSGLIEGWARNRLTWAKHFATTCTKREGPFICDKCLSDAVVRKCTEAIDHFAHHARSSPVVGAAESDLHKACKYEILAALRSAYPQGKWEQERTFKAKPEKKLNERQPDLSGYVESWPVVIEIQASALSIREIIARTSNYTRRQCFVLWIVPLKEDLGTKPFIPRLYERYFHSIYFGRTYYWLPGDGASLRPVHYDIASRFIEERTWYDTDDDEEKTAGGDWRNYVIVKTPNPGVITQLSPAGFGAMKRASFVPWNAKKAIPGCRILRDNQREWWNRAAEEISQPDYYRYE